MDHVELTDKKGAKRYLQISDASLERLMRAEDGLPYIKMGSSRTCAVRFLVKDLADYVNRRRIVPTLENARKCGSGQGAR